MGDAYSGKGGVVEENLPQKKVVGIALSESCSAELFDLFSSVSEPRKKVTAQGGNETYLVEFFNQTFHCFRRNLVRIEHVLDVFGPRFVFRFLQ